MEKLKDSFDNELKKCIWTALSQVETGGDHRISKHYAGIEESKHIFISYSSAFRPLIRRIHQRLVAAGHNVWVDWEDLQGSTLEAMGKAVEDASTVLICYSEKYKESPYCRIEAEYTFRLQKRTVFLLTQRDYEPNGWLGALLGAHYSYDFSGHFSFDMKFEELLKALKPPPRVAAMDPSNDTQKTSRPAGSAMSERDVQDLFQRKGMRNVPPALRNVNGDILLHLKVLRDTDSLYFHKEVKEEYGMSLVDFCRLCSALDEIH